MIASRWALSLGAAMALAGCHGGGDSGDESDAAVPAVVQAQTMVVNAQPFTESIDAIGTVQPRAGHVASMSPAAAGRVASVFVSVGQAVNVGQPLVALDAATFTASLESARAALSAAQQNYDRQQRLNTEGIAARKDVESAAADLAKARADLVSAERESSNATLRAPIAGVVTKLNATIGAGADPAQPLVEIADPNALDILLTLTPSDAGRVHAGAKVTLSAGQSATGEPLGVGTVVDVNATVDTMTRGVTARVEAPTTRRRLRIGETIYGQIAVGTKPNAVVVPVAALVPEGETFHVFVVDAQNVAHEREVKVGGRTESQAEITEGLRAGERIVTTGAYGMSDSAKVAPLKAAPAP